MRKIIVSMLAILSLTGKSQEFKYCELVGYVKPFAMVKMYVVVDTGQGFGYTKPMQDSAEITKPAETRTEKKYIQTDQKLFEGKEVMSDAKGKFIWVKVETKPSKTEVKTKPKTFVSMIEAMNIMGKEGWEFVQAYTVTHDNQSVYHYVLKKKKT